MNLYSIDIKIYATAYIKAKTANEALVIAKNLKDWDLELEEDRDADLQICSLPFADPELPGISLSPFLTIHGPNEGDKPELVHADND